MDATNQDSTTGDEAGGITQRVKGYCDKAVENLKAGRLDMARVLVQLPARYPMTKWPKGLRIKFMDIFLQKGHAEVKLMDGTTLKPHIPIDQLARFLNEHVQGAVKNLLFGGGEGLEDGALRLLDEVTVPGRLHVDLILFHDFFHLPWAGIERILDGRTLRANTITFTRLQLPSGVDANKLFKLPTVCECPLLSFYLRLPQQPGPPPLFDNAALMEWLEESDDRIRALILPSDYLSSGHLSFLDALKKNFQQATQVHTYSLDMPCPSINGVTGGLGVLDEVLSNRLGEKMGIEVVADPDATEKMGYPFEALHVTRASPLG